MLKAKYKDDHYVRGALRLRQNAKTTTLFEATALKVSGSLPLKAKDKNDRFAEGALRLRQKTY
jgi:hypothetical protein